MFFRQYLQNELVLRIADILANHLFAQAVSIEQELGYTLRALLQELLLDQIVNSLLRLSIKHIQADQVLPLAHVKRRLDSVYIAVH